jgi:uracil permease
MATSKKEIKVMGFLPNERPEIGQMILLGFQHVLTMFPATVLCALLMGFHVNTVLTITGLGTIITLIGAKLSMGKYIPLYYGSSFSYIAAVVAITNAQFGVPAEDRLIQIVQAGFIATGVINVVTGLIIRAAGGKEAVDKVLPPVITGSVACTIGIGLGAAALNNASGYLVNSTGIVSWWIVALITLVSTILFSVYLQGKGFIGMLPVLLGAIVGYVVAIPFGLVDFSMIGQSNLITAPHITFPVFNDPLTLTVIFGIGVMAIATIPESTAHLYQISLYVDHLAD